MGLRSAAAQLAMQRTSSSLLAIVNMSVCSSVCQSVTRWYCVKTTQSMITKSSPSVEGRLGKFSDFRPLSRRALESVPDSL